MARRAGPGRQVAAADARRYPGAHLYRDMVGLADHPHRVLPGLRADPRGEDPGGLRAVLAVPVPPRDGQLRRRAEQLSPLQVAAVGLDRAHPAGRLLLRELHVGVRRASVPEELLRAAVVTVGPGDRE